MIIVLLYMYHVYNVYIINNDKINKNLYKNKKKDTMLKMLQTFIQTNLVSSVQFKDHGKDEHEKNAR